MKLTERERELIEGMIEVNVHHAARALQIKNPMGQKQAAWDMERVILLKKILKEDL